MTNRTNCPRLTGIAVRDFPKHAAKRIEQVEASIERYLATLDRADREASDVPQALVEQFREKIAGLRGQMRFLKEMAAQVEAALIIRCR